MSLPTTPFVSCDALAAHLGDPQLLLLDLRHALDGGREAYEAGHIPGAVYSDYMKDGWRWSDGKAPGLMPPLVLLAALLGRLGITPQRHVVLIPSGKTAADMGSAARVFWTLKAVGHPRVSVLEGGYREWILDPSCPVAQGPVTAPEASAYPVALQPGYRSEADRVLAVLNAGSATLVDARTPANYRGDEMAAESKRPGHIPGALSRDCNLTFDLEKGRMKSAEELKALFAEVSADRPVVSYCNTGHTAALNWFALTQIIGRSDVTLYDGSMTDWTQVDTRPVKSGAEP